MRESGAGPRDTGIVQAMDGFDAAERVRALARAGASDASPQDIEMMERAGIAALDSHDAWRPVGASLLTVGGDVICATNRLPDGTSLRYPERMVRPAKYSWLQHAERRLFSACARRGIATEGAHLWCTLCTCDQCAGACIDSGVARVTMPLPDFLHARWGDSFVVAVTMLAEAGVEVCFLDPRFELARGPDPDARPEADPLSCREAVPSPARA